jgi:ABC-type transport system involved in multi-copper enzyme maturation permease subunit
MWYKILTITRKELYVTFTDRNLLILMLAAPLAISVIVGLVFGGLGQDGSGLSIADVPLALVNLDAGADQQGQPVNYGSNLVSLFLPGSTEFDLGSEADCPLDPNTETSTVRPNMALNDLFAAETLDDVAGGRAGVDNGEYAALVVIPEDYSVRLTPNINPTGQNTEPPPPAEIEIYANSGQPIEASIVRAVVAGFNNQLLTGSIAIGASINQIIQENPIAALQLANAQDDPAVGELFACGFSNALATVSLDTQDVSATEETADNTAESLTSAILVQTGSAQAVFFALFAGQFGVLSIINERRTGTLQRMLASPTPRNVILIGKLFGTFVMVVVQISLLLVALMLVASILEGQVAFIWGTNLLAILAVTMGLALCVAGFGVLLTGLARTPEQVGPISAVVNIGLAAISGAFGFAPVLPLAYVSMIYWGTDAYSKLAAGNADILLNMVVLAGQGVLLFIVGLWLFNRRIEI